MQEKDKVEELTNLEREFGEVQTRRDTARLNQLMADVFVFRYTRVWIKRQGRRQALAAQSTSILAQ